MRVGDGHVLALLMMVAALWGQWSAHARSRSVFSGKTSWTFPHDIAEWEGLGSKITPQALRDMDGTLFECPATSAVAIVVAAAVAAFDVAFFVVAVYVVVVAAAAVFVIVVVLFFVSLAADAAQASSGCTAPSHARTLEGTWSPTAAPTPPSSETMAAGAFCFKPVLFVAAVYRACVLNFMYRTGPEACNSSDPDANGLGTKWCGAVSRDVLLALTLPNHYSLLAVLASMLPGL